MRERGLKQLKHFVSNQLIYVAPHAGAWIETCVSPPIFLPHQKVAPHAGAWIETSSDFKTI